MKAVEVVMEVEAEAALAVAQGDSVVATMAADRSSVEDAVVVSVAATSVEDAEDLRVAEEADTMEVVGAEAVGKAFGSL